MSELTIEDLNKFLVRESSIASCDHKFLQKTVKLMVNSKMVMYSRANPWQSEYMRVIQAPIRSSRAI